MSSSERTKSKKIYEKQPNTLLKRARLDRGWSQQEVANFIGVPQTFMISRWESGITIPNPGYRERLCELFGKKHIDLGFPEASLPFNPLALNFHQPLYDPAIPLRLSNRSAIIGRSLLLKHLKRIVCHEKATRLIALNGLPGVGKTSLALALVSDPEVRAYFHDGILWAGLGSAPHLQTHFHRWGRLFSLGEQERSQIRYEREWMQALRALLGERHMLIIIDDAWTLDDALMCTIGGAHCVYVLTTRIAEVATCFAEKQAIHVPELHQKDGVQLLSELLPTSIVETETQVLHELVQAVGGLPLALNLLGTYLLQETRFHQPRRIQAALQRLLQIETRFQIAQQRTELYQEPATAHPASLSLQATISMSVAFLHENAKKALFALSIFPAKPNSFSEDAALAVVEVEVAVLDHLVDMGLLEAQREGRYQLHQVIADYARIYLPGERIIIEERMIRYWLCQNVDQHATPGLFKPSEADIENILQAFELVCKRNMPDLLVQGVLSYYSTLKYQGIFQQLENLLTQAKEAAHLCGKTVERIKLLLYLAQTQKLLGNYSEVERNVCEGLQLLSESCPQEYKLYQALLIQLASVKMFQGNYEQAKEQIQKGVETTQEDHPSEELCHLLRLLGIIVDFQGETLQARLHWQKSLEVARKLEGVEELIHSLGTLGSGLARQERYQEANLYLYEGLQLAQEHRYFSEISNFYLDLGDIALIQNAYDQAEAHLQQALVLSRRMQLHPTLSVVLATLGELELKRNRDDRAEVYLQEGLKYAREKGNNDFVGAILTIQTEVYLFRKDVQNAERTVSEALNTLPTDNKLHVANAHYCLARVLYTQGQQEKALEQAKMSISIFEGIGNSKADDVRIWLEEHQVRQNPGN